MTPSYRRTALGAVAGLATLLGLNAGTLQAVNIDFTWTGTTDAFWATPTNWSPGGPPGFLDNLLFGLPNNTTNINNAPNVFNSIVFISGAVPFTLTGASLGLDAGGITNNSTSLQTIAFADAFGGIGLNNLNGSVQTWNAASGDLLITSNVAFASAVTLIVTGARNTTITGVISDAGTPPFFGTLVKDGSGILRLTARNTFPGNTTVNGGTLLVDGAIASRNTFVNAGGTLGGIGVIGGHLFNSGNVAPGDSPGTLTVSRDYTQTKNGTLTIEIAGKKNGQHDVLAVGGRAYLDGTLRLVKVGRGPRLKVGEKIAILTANQGVSGEFSKVVPIDTGTMVRTGVVYEDKRVVVKGEQGSYLEFAKKFRLTVNQRAVAGGLDKVASSGRQRKMFDYLNDRPLANIPGDLDQIAPDELTSIFTIGTALANVQTANLQRRTDDLRSGANGFSASGFHTTGSGPSYSGGFGVAGPTGSEGKDSKKMFVPPEENRWGAFLTGVGEWVDVDGDGNARGYDVTTGGFTLGLDYKLTPNLAIGIATGYAGTGADLTNNGRVLVNGGKLGFYATYFTGGFYVDTAINGGLNSYDTRRSALRGTARGETEGGEVNMLLGTGYDWKVGALSIGPTASFQYTHIGIDDFTERGSLSPLTFRSQGSDSLRSALGFKASYDWRVGGVIIKPELRASWQHEYGDDAAKLDASFNNGSGNLFTVQGSELGRDSLLVGAGLAILLNERTSTYVYYDGELFRDNYEAHNVSAGVRVAF